MKPRTSKAHLGLHDIHHTLTRVWYQNGSLYFREPHSRVVGVATLAEVKSIATEIPRTPKVPEKLPLFPDLP